MSHRHFFALQATIQMIISTVITEISIATLKDQESGPSGHFPQLHVASSPVMKFPSESILGR